MQINHEEIAAMLGGMNPVGVEAHMREMYGSIEHFDITQIMAEGGLAAEVERRSEGYILRCVETHGLEDAYQDWQNKLSQPLAA